MKYSTYLFDFDGTLVDSMPTYVSVMLRILDENGIGYDKDIIKIITPLGYSGTAKYYVEHYGLKMSEDEIVRRMQTYIYDEYAHRILAKPDVIETLRQLKSEGKCLNILTASPHSVLDVCLDRLGMRELFTNVWSCDDFETAKSDPQIYISAAERMGVSPSEVLFLDDNLNANKTASAAGMTVCGVFDPSSAEYADEIKAVADYYIESFRELLSI